MSNNSIYNPYRALNELQQQMQQMWQQNGNSQREEGVNWSPSIDIYEAEGELVLMSELPGFTESDFKLSVENNVLTISGERKPAENRQFKVHRQERPIGRFQRSFSLPANFDLSKVNANYNNGILKIQLPKKAEARPRQIPVKIK